MRRFTLFRLVASLLAIAVFCLASLPAAAARAGTPAAPDAAISSVLASAISVAAGGSHTCAVTSGGRVKCWGWNGYGQLGDGTTDSRTTPMDVSGLASGVIGVAAGRYHTCAVTAGGGVKCWGSNGRGQLGDGTTTDRLTPVDVSGLGSGVSALAAGAEHTCAVTAGGGVKCWGYNGYGQLGDGTTIGRTTPVDVNGLGSGVSVVAAGRYHTCVMTAGGVKCWGGNSNGQLGDGTTQSRTTPVDVSGLGSGVTAVAAGESHTCAVMDAVHGGGVKCWGYNYRGQLGDGTTTDRLVPVDVSGLANGVSAVAAGTYHSCAMKAEGGVKCWGFNIFGQLGDGTAGDRNVPTDVSGLASGVSGVAAGGDHTCAVMDTVRGGGLKCWGNNGSGQLGNGTTDKHTTPVEVSGLASGVNVVAAGGFHTCAVTNGAGSSAGAQHRRPVGGRHDGGTCHPDGRERAGERGERRGGRRLPHLCGDEPVAASSAGGRTAPASWGTARRSDMPPRWT